MIFKASRHAYAVVVFFLAVSFQLLTPATASAQWPQFYGQANVINGYAQGFNYNFVRRGIDYSGGDERFDEDGAPLLEQTGIIRMEALRVRVGGERNSKTVTAMSTLANLRFMVGGNLITAVAINSYASGRCATSAGPTNPPTTSEIIGLVVNGIPVVVTGASSQVIPLPNGKVILNERKGGINANAGYVALNAVHIIVNGVPGVPLKQVADPIADIVLGNVEAYELCECPGYNNAAATAGAVLNLPSLSTAVLRTDRTSGLWETAETVPNFNVQDVLAIETARTSQSGNFPTTFAKSSLLSASLNALGTQISVGMVQAEATATCGGKMEASSQVGRLTINGQNIAISGQPNQTVAVGNVVVVLNEQKNLTKTGIQVIGVHVYFYTDTTLVQLQGDVQLALAKASMTCGCPAP